MRITTFFVLFLGMAAASCVRSTARSTPHSEANAPLKVDNSVLPLGHVPTKAKGACLPDDLHGDYMRSVGGFNVYQGSNQGEEIWEHIGIQLVTEKTTLSKIIDWQSHDKLFGKVPGLYVLGGVASCVQKGSANELPCLYFGVDLSVFDESEWLQALDVVLRRTSAFCFALKVENSGEVTL